MMTKRLFPVLLCAFLITLGACQGEPPTPGSAVQFGQLQKVDGFTYGAEFRETIRVLNCDNPLGRSDTLTEAKMISRNVSWSIVGELGANADVSAVVAGAGVEASIANGYELAVDEELSRGRELELPVSPYASAEYDIVWKPIVWSGFLPFSLQAGEGRIEYLYQQVAFGEVAAYRDHTAEDCGRTAPAPQQTEFAPTAEAVVGTPVTPTAEAIAVTLAGPTETNPAPPSVTPAGTTPDSGTPVAGGGTGQPTATIRPPATSTARPPDSNLFYPNVIITFDLYSTINTGTNIEAPTNPNPTYALKRPYELAAGTSVLMFSTVRAGVPEPEPQGPTQACGGDSCFGRLTLYRNGQTVLENADLWSYHRQQFGGLVYTFVESGRYTAVVYICKGHLYKCLEGQGWQASEPVQITVGNQ